MPNDAPTASGHGPRHTPAASARRAARLLALLPAALLAPAAAAPAAAPAFTDGDQISVHDTRRLSERTWELDLSTPLIADDATNRGHGMRVTLPEGYFGEPAKRYPVIYLLHGGGGGAYSDWTDGGRVEEITAGHEVIVVMPEGGKVGWYTNWQNEWRGAQRWADFHHDAVIPFIDRNLRTIARKDGRAIGGLSMGGYGAMRLTQDRPELYASVASFSGALDIEHPGTQLVICEQSLENLYGCNDSFGLEWARHNPLRRAATLSGQDVQILLYAGSGSNDLDVIERVMGWSTHLFAEELVRLGIPHHWSMYGRPGKQGDFTCDGGHNFGCWSYAFDDALPRILSRLADATAPARPRDPLSAPHDAGTPPAGAAAAPQGGAPAPAPQRPLARQRIAGAKLAARSFRATKRTPGRRAGTTLTVRVREAGTLHAVVERAGKGYRRGKRCAKTKPKGAPAPRRCTRWTRAGALPVATLVPGTNAVPVRGAVGGRLLRPGKYRLRLNAYGAGDGAAPRAAGADRTLGFTIRRR